MGRARPDWPATPRGLPELAADGHFVTWDRVYESGEPFKQSSVRARIDGDGGDGRIHDMYFDLSLIPHRRADGSVEGILVFAVDVTTQQELSVQRQRTHQLEETLIGVVSHDLRTPLAAIEMASDLLLHDDGPDGAALKNITRIRSAANRAHRMVRDLLDFTQVRLSGRLPVHRRAGADIGPCIRHVVDEVSVTARAPDVAVSIEGDLRGHFDCDRVQQAMSNLIGNALKYGDRAQPVLVRARGTPDEVVIEVENAGSPIARELLPFLFDPMRRGDVAGRGLGLGLFIVQQIAAGHDGTVDVVSDERATTFTMRLPRT